MTDDQICERVKIQIDEINHQLDNLTELVTTLAKRVEQGFASLERRLDRIKRKLSIINDRLLSHEADIRELQEKN